jgi:hypothetical protein
MFIIALSKTPKSGNNLNFHQPKNIIRMIDPYNGILFSHKKE